MQSKKTEISTSSSILCWVACPVILCFRFSFFSLFCASLQSPGSLLAGYETIPVNRHYESVIDILQMLKT